MNSKIIVLFACFALSLALEFPGIRVGVAQEALTETNDILSPIMTNYMENIQIPEIEFKHHIDLMGEVTITISESEVEKISLGVPKFTITDTGVTYDTSHLEGKFKTHYKYRQDRWPHAHQEGDVQLEFTKSTFTVSADVTAGGDGHPVVDTSGHFHIKHISVKFHDTLDAWLKDLIVDIIAPRIRREVGAKVDAELVALGPVLTARIKQVPIPLPLNATGDLLALNWAMVENPVFETSRIMSFASEALMMDYAHMAYPPYNVSAIPAFNGSHLTEVIVSEESVSSALWAAWESGLLNHRIDGMDNVFGIEFNTETFQDMLPAMSDKYPNADMYIDLTCVDSDPVIEFSAPDLTTLVTKMNMKGMVEAPDGSVVDGFTFRADLKAEVELSVAGATNSTVVPSVKKVAATMHFVESQFGKVDFALINLLLKSAEKELPAMINPLIDQGFTVPSFMGLTIVDGELVFGEGYLIIGGDLAKVE